MKKKIAILLAAVMTATMVPATAAFADSSNSRNKEVSVKDGDFNDEVWLNIQPGEAVEMGDTITLTLANGEFDEDDMNAEYDDKRASWPDAYGIDKYQYKLGDASYDDLKGEYESMEGSFSSELTVFDNTMRDLMDEARTADLPYKLKRNTKRELEVELFALPAAYAGENCYGYGKPAYKIPLPFTADGSGDVTVTIDSNGTTIRGGTSYTIGKSASSSGETTTTVDDIMVGSDDIELGIITIKESVQGTFKPGRKVTLKLNSGFEFKNKGALKIAGGINTTKFELTTGGAIDLDEDTLEFTLPETIGYGKDGESDKPAAITIEGLWVTAEDDDNYGEIKVTVSGTSAGVTKETITVAERGDYGFTLRAVEDPTTIYSGRKGYDTNIDGTGYADVDDLDYDDDDDYGRYISEDVAKEYDADDYESATFEFAEITADSWNTNRRLKFNVPDEVKIYGFEIDEYEDCSNIEAMASITNDGHTLELDPTRVADDSVDPKEASSFEVKLNLSVDANYEGDITVNVEGGGISADEVEDVVIAKAVKPLTLETKSTETNMGYQKVDTADIVLTEAEGGILVKNGEVRIAIDSIYGEEELGFADENMDYEIDGDLKITKFKVSKGAITFNVDSESTDASKITIKNVKIGTTRSIPYGNYGLKVYGSAVINNYSEGAVDDGEETVWESDTIRAEKGLGYFDDNEAIKFADYIKMKTETGTLDKVVKVTIGEKTIVVDGENFEMDVAPYIQTESSSTMVPLRFVMIALGVDSDNVGSFDESGKVQFDTNTKTATIFYAAGTQMTTIQFQAGSNVMKVNGAEINMENGVKAEIVDGRMFVPFRAIGTAINVNVGWDADTRTATYNA